MKKQKVDFYARKTIKVPTEVEFTTKSGEHVGFEARKAVKKRVHVKFQAKRSGK